MQGLTYTYLGTSYEGATKQLTAFSKRQKRQQRGCCQYNSVLVYYLFMFSERLKVS